MNFEFNTSTSIEEKSRLELLQTLSSALKEFNYAASLVPGDSRGMLPNGRGCGLSHSGLQWLLKCTCDQS